MPSPKNKVWLPVIVGVAAFWFVFRGCILSIPDRLFQSEEERFVSEIEAASQTLREKAQEGDAVALFKLGWTYSDGKLGMPISKKIALQYYLTAYEKAVEQDEIHIRRDAAFSLRGLYDFGKLSNEAEAEKWRQRWEKARLEIIAREDAAWEKRVKEHEALIPDAP